MPATPITPPPLRVPSMLAAAGLALAAAGALGQGGPLSEPFPDVFDPAQLLPPAGDGTLGFVVVEPTSGDAFGAAVSAAGDVNGDGIGDFMVSAHRADPLGRSRAGETYVVFGRDGSAGPAFPAELSAANLDGSNGFALAGADQFDYSGFAIAAAGDVNGDGVGDLVIGAPQGGFQPRAGEAYIVFGRDTTSGGSFPARLDLGSLAVGEGFRIRSQFAEVRAGTSVAGLGDINGDGFDDVGIGAPGRLTRLGSEANGTALVLYGGTSLVGVSLDNPGDRGFRIDGGEYHGELGTAVSSAGDLNGDGLDDVLVGAPGERGEEYCDPYYCRSVSGGRGYVVFGRDDGAFPDQIRASDLDGSDGVILEGGPSDALLGTAVAFVDDLNGDGFGDIAVGAPYSDPEDRSDFYAQYQGGEVFVLFGRDTGFPATLDLDTLDGSDGFIIAGEADDSELGRLVSGGADVNGDGRPDAMLADRDQAAVLFGSDDAFPAAMAIADLAGGGGVRLPGFASALGPAGDTNGDGVADVVLGYRFGAFAGRALVVYGRRGGTVCSADLDGDGELTIFDFLEFQNLFSLMDPRADFDGDGEFTIFDFLAFQNAFDAGCP